MRLFWEFFTFELQLRRKSISTYVYFLLWFFFSFLCVASESFGPIGSGNGKVLLNGPFAATLNYVFISLFGVIVIAAIFGTSILRDFQRDTYQMLFTKPISKFAYLGGRWAGSLVTTVLHFPAASSASSSARSRPGPITPASAPIISGGTCSRFCPSPSYRFSFSARCSSPSQRSRARFSLSMCRAQPCS